MQNSADQPGYHAAFNWGLPEPELKRGGRASGPKRAYASSHAKDRRQARRYPLKLDLTYVQTETRSPLAVTGATADLSSHSILFTAESLPPVGSMVEARISWPVPIGGELPLRLIVFGPVLKLDSRGAVMLIKRYGFASAGTEAVGGEMNRSTARAKARPAL